MGFNLLPQGSFQPPSFAYMKTLSPTGDAWLPILAIYFIVQLQYTCIEASELSPCTPMKQLYQLEHHAHAEFLLLLVSGLFR